MLSLESLSLFHKDSIFAADKNLNIFTWQACSKGNESHGSDTVFKSDCATEMWRHVADQWRYYSDENDARNETRIPSSKAFNVKMSNQRSR